MQDDRCRELCLALLYAETEADVVSVLNEYRFWNEDEDTWVPFGGPGWENNLATINAQQAHATPALVEKLINSVDAMLIGECWRRQIDPRSGKAPESMAAAAAEFFGIRNGRLDSFLGNPKALAQLADNIHLIATGAKSTPNYLIVDRGEGQTPRAMRETFLSLSKKNKYGIRFTQGINNCGGTGVLSFLGENRLQLIISKRHPDCPVSDGDTSKTKWGFTIVRRLRPDLARNRERSMYVYLAPQETILSFAAPSLDILPGEQKASKPPTPYARGLEYGSCIKLYDYRWSAKSLATTNAREELERYLYTLCLPVRITETRKYEANYFSTTLSGLSVNIAGDKRVERPGFPDSGELNIDGIGRLQVSVTVYRSRDDEGNPTQKKRIPRGIVFTKNGQAHDRLGDGYVSGTLKFDYLKDFLVVALDCTRMEATAFEDIFPTSRDRHRDNAPYREMLTQLTKFLREHPGLRELNARRRQEVMQAGEDKSSEDLLRQLIRSDPSFADLLGLGQAIVAPKPLPPREEFVGKRFPTFFEIKKEPQGGLVKQCPKNRGCRLDFATDAENGYFSRGESPGTIEFLPPSVCVSHHLWNGILRARFVPPDEARVGDVIDVRVSVTDDSRQEPFVCDFKILVEDPVPESQEPKPPRNHRARNEGRLAMPKINMVTRDGRDIDGKPTVAWGDGNDMENDSDALEIKHRGDDEDDAFDLFINMDNKYLLHELSRLRDAGDHPLIRFWFKYGLAFAAMGIMRDVAGKNNGNGQPAGEVNGATSTVNGASRGVARVIVPVIRQLSKGPASANG